MLKINLFCMQKSYLLSLSKSIRKKTLKQHGQWFWTEEDRLESGSPMRKVPIRGYCGLVLGCVSLWESRTRGRTVCEGQPYRKQGLKGKQNTLLSSLHRKHRENRDRGLQKTDFALARYIHENTDWETAISFKFKSRS